MLRTFLLCGVLAVASAKWPGLKTTFGLNPFGPAFHSQPRTAADASYEGWQLMASCDGQFLGHRYADPADPSLVLIYDDAGYIAGLQSVLLDSDVDLAVNNLATQTTYAQSEWMGQAAWFATAYFVDPTVICAGGRSEADWEAQGTGDRLLVQNGATDNLISIPLTQAEADIDASWYNHFCFLGMGEHYLQFDYTPSQACESVLPFQILYDEGIITGFVWQHFATLPGGRWEHPDAMAVSAIIDRPPTCVSDALEYPGLSTMHHYFYDYPWLTACPFTSTRAQFRKMLRV